MTMKQLWCQSFCLLFFLTFTSIRPSHSSALRSLGSGSSLSVERPNDFLLSPDSTFSAGFRSIGINAYSFVIWFSQAKEFTPVWMANRDHPVNGRRSTLLLQRDGNLILRDGPRSVIWTTNTTSDSSVQLRLENTGNLILQTTEGNEILWQSFDSPTDTLLPGQQLTRNSKLISSRSKSNYSSGFYSLFFDNDNMLRLLFDGPEISSIYWPDPWLLSWDAGRTTFNSSRIANFDYYGLFASSDNAELIASDFGLGPKRRLTLDFDGNARIYSLNEENGSWEVSSQAIETSCKVHGLCGQNSACLQNPERRCSCAPGYKVKDPSDWSQGCEATFNLSCDARDFSFLSLPHVAFYGYELNGTKNVSFETCKKICLETCSCKAFRYIFDGKGMCYPKTLLFSGRWHLYFAEMITYIKVPKNHTFSYEDFLQGTELDCPPKAPIELPRTYTRKRENATIKAFLYFTSILGGIELVLILTSYCYMFITDRSDAIERGYLLASTGFRKFSWDELKKATKNFSEEVGRGASGAVFKGVLSEQAAVAVKRLEGFSQGEMEFLGEVSIIGRINHMNLIQMFGFCAEGKHRLLVYEYIEHGSLADNLSSNALDWEQRFKIAVGTAKGLAYLHEECLEWVLHCDIKPQNILLDADYNPKVADFGLSKLLDRHGIDRLSFSKVRGTRGYMAPEWILNLPITSKVDVYSYGIVVLEMVTGKQPAGFHTVDANQEWEGDGRLVPWVRGVMKDVESSMQSKIEKIKDPRVGSSYDVGKMELLVRVALQCVEEERDARPTMSRVVEMLLGHGIHHNQRRASHPRPIATCCQRDESLIC